jgi:hypothetical protein
MATIFGLCHEWQVGLDEVVQCIAMNGVSVDEVVQRAHRSLSKVVQKGFYAMIEGEKFYFPEQPKGYALVKISGRQAIVEYDCFNEDGSGTGTGRVQIRDQSAIEELLDRKVLLERMRGQLIYRGHKIYQPAE